MDHYAHLYQQADELRQFNANVSLIRSLQHRLLEKKHDPNYAYFLDILKIDKIRVECRSYNEFYKTNEYIP